MQYVCIFVFVRSVLNFLPFSLQVFSEHNTPRTILFKSTLNPFLSESLLQQQVKQNEIHLPEDVMACGKVQT